MHLKRRKKLSPSIPLASMADIAFLLLIFFIVTSAMKMEDASSIQIPSVPRVEVVEQDARLNLWLDRNGALKILRKTYTLEEAGIYLTQRMRLVPATVIFLNGDRRCRFRKVEAVLKTLTEAAAVRVVFVSREEGDDADR